MQRLRILICIAAIAFGTAARAESVTGSGTGTTPAEACDAARASARSQIPVGKQLIKMGQCVCAPGGNRRNCTITADY